jgi:uncharacterized protein (TIGR03437 family)
VVTDQQQLTLKTTQGTSQSVTLTVNAAEPGLLAPLNFKVSATHYVVARLADRTYVVPVGAISDITSRPMKPGDEIVLYGVGFGPVTPAILTGKLVVEANKPGGFPDLHQRNTV